MNFLFYRRSLEGREYAAASDQLRVVLNIMDEFQKYKHVDKVQELERRYVIIVNWGGLCSVSAGNSISRRWLCTSTHTCVHSAQTL